MCGRLGTLGYIALVVAVAPSGQSLVVAWAALLVPVLLVEMLRQGRRARRAKMSATLKLAAFTVSEREEEVGGVGATGSSAQEDGSEAAPIAAAGGAEEPWQQQQQRTVHHRGRPGGAARSKGPSGACAAPTAAQPRCASARVTPYVSADEADSDAAVVRAATIQSASLAQSAMLFAGLMPLPNTPEQRNWPNGPLTVDL